MSSPRIMQCAHSITGTHYLLHIINSFIIITIVHLCSHKKYYKTQELQISTCNSVGLLSKLSRQFKGWFLLQKQGGKVSDHSTQQMIIIEEDS